MRLPFANYFGYVFLFFAVVSPVPLLYFPTSYSMTSSGIAFHHLSLWAVDVPLSDVENVKRVTRSIRGMSVECLLVSANGKIWTISGLATHFDQLRDRILFAVGESRVIDERESKVID